jgi:lambda family phage minor tail protein L
MVSKKAYIQGFEAMLKDIQKLQNEAPLFLFELSNYNRNAPEDKIHFCNFNGVVFGGISYEAIPCQISGLDLTSEGTLPSPTLVVADVNNLVSYLSALYEGLEGARLKVFETRPRFLDNGASPDPTAIIENPYLLVIESRSEIPNKQVSFELSVPIAFSGGEKVPTRGIYQTCSFTYRGGQCQYLGSRMWDINNKPTTDPNKDQCNKTIAACKLRFKENGVLRHGGFVGARQFD